MEQPAKQNVKKNYKKLLKQKQFLNKQLRKIIAKATEKKQKDRYQSAAQFRAELENVTLEPEENVHTSKPLPINKDMIIAAVLCVLGFAFGAVVAILIN